MRTPHVRCVRVSNRAQFIHCTAIREKVFIVEQNVPREIEIDEHDRLDDPLTRHYLLMVDGHPLGTARTLMKEPGILKIQRFAMMKSVRGQGLGKQFLLSIEADSDPSIKTFILDAQVHAIPFYESCGYTVIGEQFLEAGIEHKTMLKAR